MIKIDGNYLRIDTAGSTYLMKILPTGHVENVYYGARFDETDYSFIEERNLFGCGVKATAGDYAMFPDCKSFEYSTRGRGDFREPSAVINAGGDEVNEFLFESADVIDGFSVPELPSSAGKSETLRLTLRDESKNLTLKLYYSTFCDSDVIVKSASVRNDGESDVTIERIASSQLDICGEDFLVDTLNGLWAKERQICTSPLAGGVTKIDSKYGYSSAERNPYVVVKRSDCTNFDGDCYGFNLIYSGNHATYIDKSQFKKIRVICGINDSTFSWRLGAGETFYTPEATVCYSNRGTNGLTQSYHSFINEHIVRGYWKGRVRPILCNNWEATNFDFTEEKLIKIARRAATLGAELFVLDDGWFGGRTDDTTGLGDWTENPERLPDGLKGLAEKINALGLDFGIWVEPEMISPKSELYRRHPDWAVRNPDYTPLLQRNQYVLDLCNPDVCEFVIDAMTKVFSSANIAYVKWDCNRSITELYSPLLGDRQKEFSHRYMLGLYEILDTLTARFPKILFESCAAGGNRVDMGMLCYAPQFWASDNTDFYDRAKIQEGTLTCYPQSTMGAHVSRSPNNQTLRQSTIENRFNTACMGAFGYEMDLSALSAADTKAVLRQIKWYKKYRKTLQFGTYYRIKSVFGGGRSGWEIVSPDKKQAVVGVVNGVTELYAPQTFMKVYGLDPDTVYTVETRPQYLPVAEGDRYTAVYAPSKIESDDDVIAAAEASNPKDCEHERYEVSGKTLGKVGVRLNTEWMGGGDPTVTRIMYDFGSRLYTVIATDKKI